MIYFPRIKSVFKTIFFVVIVLTVATFWYDQYLFYFAGRDTPTECPADSNVAVIKIYGPVVTYKEESADLEESKIKPSDTVSSEEILDHIGQTKENNEIKAVIVKIDS